MGIVCLVAHLNRRSFKLFYLHKKVSEMDAARATFEAFAKYGDTKADGTTIDNKKFSKLCKECKIMNKACTSTDVDIVFSKVKTKGARVITFDQFCEALKDLSKKRFKPMPTVSINASSSWLTKHQVHPELQKPQNPEV